ncbi:histidinol-phosphate transaminase [Halostella pelagica]|uniref:histidinol-phosphate transaminase n=1 Tax=Halostella pelagica TaxID=2583824 RepID=UPI001080BBC1|nr:histidinol-phosphate transaminase [Halostella pelagica]
MQPRDLSDHVPYEAGRGIEEVARELGADPGTLTKLASNENPLGPSPAASEAIREAADSASTYPTAAHTDLTAAVADAWSVADEQIWLGNGGDGALDYLSRAMLNPGDEVLVPAPGFSYYGMSARYHHGEVTEYALSADDGFAMDADAVLDAYDGERIVYVNSPHNPTGRVMALDEIARVARETGDETLVVVDEAYGEYADAPSAVSLVGGDASKPAGLSDATETRETREDVAVVRTFSKAYGLAGVRLGYAVVPEAWADAYARVNTPFAASEVACRAGLAAMDDRDHVEQSLETAAWAREYMQEHIEAQVLPSAGNFVLANVGDGTEVYEQLKRRGVIVRDVSSYGLPEWVRITCGDREQTRTAVAELNEVLG